MCSAPVGGSDSRLWLVLVIILVNDFAENIVKHCKTLQKLDKTLYITTFPNGRPEHLVNDNPWARRHQPTSRPLARRGAGWWTHAPDPNGSTSIACTRGPAKMLETQGPRETSLFVEGRGGPPRALTAAGSGPQCCARGLTLHNIVLSLTFGSIPKPARASDDAHCIHPH